MKQKSTPIREDIGPKNIFNPNFVPAKGAWWNPETGYGGQPRPAAPSAEQERIASAMNDAEIRLRHLRWHPDGKKETEAYYVQRRAELSNLSEPDIIMAVTTELEKMYGTCPPDIETRIAIAEMRASRSNQRLPEQVHATRIEQK